MAALFRWGILGASTVADEALIPAIASSHTSAVHGIASRNADRAGSLAAKHGIPISYGSYEELLGDDDVDGVYVSLPNALHRDWTIAALEHGKHVLCEKPLALTAEKAREIEAASLRCDRVAMEAFMYRFDEETNAFLESAPQPRYVHATATFRMADDANIRLDATLGGGALLDLGCYAVDVIRRLLGEPQSVAALAIVDGVDRSVAATLGFGDGTLATFWVSFEAPPLQELTVVGDDGIARTSHRPFASYFDAAVPDRFAPQRTMVEAFVDCVRGGRPSPIPLAESIATLAVLDRVREAAGIDG